MKVRQYILEVADFDACRQCGTCSRLLPDFRRKWGGKVLISGANYDREQTRETIRAVVEACPAGVIQCRQRE